MKQFTRIALALFVVTLMLASCTFPSGDSSNVDENAVNTSVAQTLIALGSAATQPVDQPTMAVELPTVTSAPLPTAALPTVAPTAVPPTPLPTQDACNRAKWLEDVTVPDGSVYLPNVTFTKTWRIQNAGTCTWNPSYAIVFSSGDHMGEAGATAFLGNVAPGATVDISVNMKSPATNGEYTTYFMLRSDTGLIYGTGSSYNAPLFANIKVSQLMLIPTLFFGGHIFVFPLETVIYDFAGNYCSANWVNSSGSGNLPCPGNTSSAAGYVVRNDNPVLSDGVTYNGVALVTHPQWISGGSIAGVFPAVAITDGMKFRATLGCRQGGNACDVRYFLRYYDAAGGGLQSFKQWDVKYTDTPIKVEVDLASLAGKNIIWVLQTVALDTANQDWAQWVNPRIVK